MKIKSCYLGLLFIFFISCATSVVHNLHYDIVLYKVEKPDKAKTPYGELKISATEDGDYKYIFEDEMIKTLWLPTPKQILFHLENKTDLSIKIIWEKAAYICERGKSHRVIHTGVNYGRNLPLRPTVVIQRGVIADFIYPADYISYKDDNWAERPGWSGLWIEKPLLVDKKKGGDPKKLLSKAKKNIGKTIQVLLPIESEGMKKIYLFTFLVKDVDLVKK